MPRPTTTQPRFEVRVPPEEKARWEHAAKLDDLTLSQWVRRTLKRAAKRASPPAK
jgi:predicted HicB family RNase H-like nuclease